MRAVVQRVAFAGVSVDDRTIGEIGRGVLVFLAIHQNDTEEMVEKMAQKIIKLRMFHDENKKMNKSVVDVGGEVLVISQFTLYGDTSKGNRPGFTDSARPEKAIPYYNKFVSFIEGSGLKTATGQFGAEMKVELLNDGPVTLIIDL